MSVLTIDGSMGEGGGQILRSSLALSLITQTPFRITGIRAGRRKPGLLRSHLCAVEAARRISEAEVSGAELGSTELSFRPGKVRGGNHTFAIGSSGSTSLVVQTVLLPLLLSAAEPSRFELSGGTHNPFAPTFDFLELAYIPLLRRMGATVRLSLERPGFHPAGGGRVVVEVAPCPALRALELATRGPVTRRSARAMVSMVPTSVALREIATLRRLLSWSDDVLARPVGVANPIGAGNALVAVVESEHVTEVFSAIGERGISAEDVAGAVARDVQRYLASDVAVFEHLADQLMLPMALGQGGVFRTVGLTEHARTQRDVLALFTDARIDVDEEGDDRTLVTVRR